MAKAQLNILVKLARIDGVLVQDEIALIKKIGRAHGMTNQEIQDCFEHPYGLESLEELTPDEKYEFLYDVIQLMKIDGRLHQEEIQFCARAVAKLGYDQAVLLEMLLKIYGDDRITANKESLKQDIQKFLKP